MAVKSRILIVDDEIFNLDILEENLTDAGFETVRAEDGTVAMHILEQSAPFDLVVLDRMMPKMDGIQVLKSIKSNTRLRDIPVIMQTADGQNQHMMEGIQAGAYYYLIKPYDENLLLSIVKSALFEAKSKKEMREITRTQKDVVGLMEQARFRFRTLEEAGRIAVYISRFCPAPDKAVYGLNELMINAVEHGNLRLSYEDKPLLLSENRWQAEVERLLALPENERKFATLVFTAKPDEILITITDEGKGFNWKNYLDFDPIRMTEPFGRGIAMSKTISFSELEYASGGREAICRIPLR